MVRLHFQEWVQIDPHGTSVALFVSNLPKQESERKYETCLLDLLGKGIIFIIIIIEPRLFNNENYFILKRKSNIISISLRNSRIQSPVVPTHVCFVRFFSYCYPFGYKSTMDQDTFYQFIVSRLEMIVYVQLFTVAALLFTRSRYLAVKIKCTRQ